MKNNNKNIHFFAIAALAATLMVGQVPVSPVYAEAKSVQMSSLIPDNVTIEEPVPLSEISLPNSEYGMLSWIDDSCVPAERVQSYDVVFKPYDTAVLSEISGWDGESDAIYSSVTVVVNSIASDSEKSEEWEEGSEDNYETGNDENQDGYDENSSEIEEDQDANTEGKEEESKDSEQESEPEATITEKPSEDETENAEITEKPSENEKSEEDSAEKNTEKSEDKGEAEAEAEGEITVTPAVTETPEATEVPEITKIPTATITPEADKDNIFDGTDKDLKEDDRSTIFEENLTDEQKNEMAEENHSCNGITVSGIDLPYYVQFRVASGDNYEFTNASEANVFQSYEFELWDLKNNTEYDVPDGEYVSVTVPVKAGYSYTIEHLLDSGAMETIVPSVDGSTMVFSTHSFSPFGIAGSKTLVGEEIEEDGYDTADSAGTSDLTPAADNASAGNTTVAPELTAAPEDSTVQSSDSSDETQKSQEDNSSSVKAVHTNDPTKILPFMILAAAAAAIVGVIVYLRRKK